MLYLASPYSHAQAAVRDERFRAVCAQAAGMMRDGQILFSPIAHTHPILLAGELPTGWDFWERVDRAFLRRCDCLAVLMLPGWQESVGVQAEIAIARELNIPVSFLEPGRVGGSRGNAGTQRE
jgi:hypothetical protein